MLLQKGASNALLLRSTIRKILAEFRLIAVECRCISTSTHRVCFEAKSYFSRLVRKPVLVVSDQIRHKPDCTITVKWLATLHLGSTGYICSFYVAKTKMLICVLVFSYANIRFSHDAAHL